MKIDPTKMIETEIQWLLNFECGTNLGKVLAYNVLEDFLCQYGVVLVRVQSVLLVYSEVYILVLDPKLSRTPCKCV